MISFLLNGERQSHSTSLSISELLKQINTSSLSIAVAVNHEIVPRSQFDSKQVQHDDQVEIIKAVGGG